MKRRKYRNEPCEVVGHHFDSKKERKRYGELRLLSMAGELKDLILQPRFRLEVNGMLVCEYLGDFAYTRIADGARVVEDVKSPITRKHPVYAIKKKLMRAVLGIEIEEV